MHANLPAAVDDERAGLIEAALRGLAREGFRNFRVHEHPGYPDPDPVRISVLNIGVVPDLCAEHAKAGAPLVACIEVHSDLSTTECGRTWEALSSWAREHGARFCVFVPADALEPAQRIAQHWNIDPACLRPVTEA